jgi:hypothetical protein
MKKTLRFVAAVGSIASLLLIGSCSKDKYQAPKPSIPTSTSGVISSQGNTGLTYQESSLPSSTASVSTPEILDIYTNANVITGGANQLTITLDDPEGDVTSVVYGVKGLPGYYSQAITTAGSGTTSVDISIFMNQIPNEGNFVLQIALVDDAGNVSGYKEIPIKLITVGMGKLQVSLSWDKNNDVDIHLVLPSGKEIFYGDPNGQGSYDDPYYDFTGITGNTLLDLDSNPDCYIDGVNNENITFGDIPLEVGVYTVRVDYYADCLGSETTNYIATARLNGSFITPLTGSNPYNGSFAPDTDDMGEYGSGTTVMTFQINSANGRLALDVPPPAQNNKVAKEGAQTVSRLSKLKKLGR